MKREPPQERDPPEWITRIFAFFVTAGGYSKEWLPEVLDFFEELVRQQGERHALTWLMGDFRLTFAPGQVLLMYSLFRVFWAVWKYTKRLKPNDPKPEKPSVNKRKAKKKKDH